MTLLAAPPLGIAAADQPAVSERAVAEAQSTPAADEVAEVARDVVDDLARTAEKFALLASDCTHLGRVLFARHLNASFLERRRLLGATDQPNDNRDNPGKAHPASLPPDVVDRLTHDRYNEDQGDTERERGYRQGWNDHARHMLRMFAAREAL